MAQCDAAFESGAQHRAGIVRQSPFSQLHGFFQALECRLEYDGCDRRLAGRNVIQAHTRLSQAFVYRKMHALLRPRAECLPVCNEAAQIVLPDGLLPILCEGHRALRQVVNKLHCLIQRPRLVGVQAQSCCGAHLAPQHFSEPVCAARVLYGVLADFDLQHSGAIGRLVEVLLPHHQGIDANVRRTTHPPGRSCCCAEVRCAGHPAKQVQQRHLQAAAHRWQQVNSFWAILLEPSAHCTIEPGDIQGHRRWVGRPSREH
mmetsp:Transcript_59176/g.163671  ORF Transcript_59176/g.163671 Transcript_59176/m.163671 type:complete len:259 (+) Transcript_59176:433-1209(+)